MPPKKVTIPIRPTEGSSLTHEECEYLEFRLSRLEKKVNEIDGSMLKKLDLSKNEEKIWKEMEKDINGNKGGIEKKINENKEEIKRTWMKIRKKCKMSRKTYKNPSGKK